MSSQHHLSQRPSHSCRPIAVVARPSSNPFFARIARLSSYSPVHRAHSALLGPMRVAFRGGHAVNTSGPYSGRRHSSLQSRHSGPGPLVGVG